MIKFILAAAAIGMTYLLLGPWWAGAVFALNAIGWMLAPTAPQLRGNCFWDSYCEKGVPCCLDQNCPCVDNWIYRYRNARARGLNVISSMWYSGVL